jgi:hypothetical protein
MFQRCHTLLAVATTTLLTVGGSALAAEPKRDANQSESVRSAFPSALPDGLRSRGTQRVRLMRVKRSRARKGDHGDRIAPETTIISGPSGTISVPAGEFAFSASEAGSTFECRLDAGEWHACSSPEPVSGMTDGKHTFAVRAIDRARNTDPTPAERSFAVELPSVPPPDPSDPPEPPSSDSIVPGTGTVLAEDLMTEANPCVAWGRISDPHLDGCDSSGGTDPFIVRRTGDGDPHVAIGQRAPSQYYRRYISRAGVQSVYDTGVQNENTRTQTQKWSTSQNPMSFGPGRYVFYLSFRLQELANGESVHPNELVAGGGIARFTQLFQFKSFGGPGANVGTFGSSIGANGIRFKADDQNHNNSVRYLYGLEPGEWYRIAVVAEWDADGWYEVWADLDQNGSMVRVLDRQYGRDFLADQPSSAWGIGLYHHMDLFDGTEPGQPRQETVYTDYANAQITNYQP